MHNGAILYTQGPLHQAMVPVRCRLWCSATQVCTGTISNRFTGYLSTQDYTALSLSHLYDRSLTGIYIAAVRLNGPVCPFSFYARIAQCQRSELTWFCRLDSPCIACLDGDTGRGNPVGYVYTESPVFSTGHHVCGGIARGIGHLHPVPGAPGAKVCRCAAFICNDLDSCRTDTGGSGIVWFVRL